ncbi:MAG: FtsX-like permease family protein [Trebonia sp.]|uniref:FtsX-like permease family protein n=1 Tax=Trebonia sp. TaxID=2767075 RepID=UPI003BAE9703
MSIALREPPDLDADPGSGIVARRAVIRWGWRLFRREWRQQLLVLGLLTVAVAATIWGASVVTNSQIPPSYPTFGTGAARVTLPGSDPQLAADIAMIAGRWGPADLIEEQNVTAGARQSVQLRAEGPHGHYNAPLLGLVSGTYPAGPGQVALTSQVATRYGAHVGGTWHAAGTTWQVTGIVADPSTLADQFALVASGQIRHPGQVIMLLGPAAAQELLSDQTVPGVPAANVSVPTQQESGVSPAVQILVVEVLGLAFIGLLSVASFSVLAQRRLRALGMLGAIGATERNLRLVMIAGGLVVGATAALAGTVLGLVAWFAYAPTVQRDTGHAVDAAHLPWWAFAIGILLAIATSALASRRPAKTMAAVPVVTALSGRPAPPKAAHRSALPGVIVLAVGLACLASAGGLNGLAGYNGPGSSGGGNGQTLFLLGGLVAAITGVCLLAPLAISVLAAGAAPRLPVAIRIALRDLVRYRARSGAALAATTFAVFLAMGICVVASIKFDSPLNWIGPDLSNSQVTVGASQSSGPGQSTPLSNAQLATLTTRVNTLAASLHASAVPLESPSGLYQVGPAAHGVQNFTGEVYVATPQLLATYGIKASQIAPGTDILTMRPGLAGEPHMEMTWDIGGVSDSSIPPPPPGFAGGTPCTLSNHCLASPAIATVSSLPSGTSAPNTVVTEYAVSKYHMQAQLFGWLIQAPAPFTAAQLSTVRQFGNANEVQVLTATYNPSLADFTRAATALGIVIALSVLAMSVGLIRSETAPDLRTLTATGASGATRRLITAATAAALGLLGAILGMAGAVLAGMAWTHSGPTATAGGVPITDIVILLIGLPLVAAVGGWLFAGREPPTIARQPIE